MHKLLLSLSLLVVGFVPAAHADTFIFSGLTESNSVGTGTILTNGSGIATEGQITFTGGQSQGTYTFYEAGMRSSITSVTLVDSQFTPFLLFLHTSLAGVSTDNVCSDTSFCGNLSSNVMTRGGSDFLLSGTLSLQTLPTPAVAAAATPEPSSLILLGTGILGMAGAARRKFLHA